MNEYILQPERDGELILAIRAQCPQDLALLAELHSYLLQHRPRAARLRRWAGLCLADSTILIDPAGHDLLETYLHELAHATVGPHRGHDQVFAELALTLYKRFGVERDTRGKYYDFHEAALHEVTPAKQAIRESRAREAAAQPLPVAAMSAVGLAADRLDAAVASSLEWSTVLVPLFWLCLTVIPVLLFWLFREHFPRIIQQWPLESAGVAACALCLLVAFWPSRR